MTDPIPAPTTPTPTTEAAPAASVAAAPAAAPVEAAPVDPLAAPTILGGEDVAKPDEAKPADAAPVGAPEKYELVAPEGTTLDAESVALAEPVFRDLNLTNEQANTLMPVAAQFAQRVMDQANRAIIADVVATRAQWAKDAEADAEIGGTPEHHATVVAAAAKAIDRFGGAPFRAFLNETGLGNHPDMVRFAYRAGLAISEDGDFPRSDAAAKPKLTPEQKFYPHHYPAT